jgi:NAD(P)-dependent dehydrogenase (short-subunit alcohol dehydrogenase family)
MDRYNVSKLLQTIVTRCLAAAAHDSARDADVDVIINSVHPGLCQTQLFRSVPFPVSVVMRLSLRAVGRTPEVGSRCLVAGALAGPESHGKYMEDCAVADYPSIMNGDAGVVMQAKVWEELLAILEDIPPDISKLI